MVKAVALGRSRITYPSMFAAFFPWLLFIVLSNYGLVESVGTKGFLWFAFFFGGGFVLGWLVWSVQVPKWRLQAYSIVENIEELKEAAIAASLIWPDKSIFTKTEIASKELREKIRLLESKKSQSGSKE
ncbi:hypothetical protein [Bdellovibrio bacteriovorus]|uniref:hypothetical protein n=1 Tax=Bdellovibrio bacteriovorus TaxID=959 RepID=UPI0035A6FDD3